MRFLIVGCGSIGQRHLRNLIALGYEDVIVVDPIETVITDINSNFGIAGYLNLDDALTESPDAVILANPTAYHIPSAIQAAKSGAHLLIEKPISHSMDYISELIIEVKAHNLVAMVAYSLRFFEGINLIRDLLVDQVIGDVLHAQAEVGQYLPDWRPGVDYRISYSAMANQGGGVVLDLSHEIDYLVWLFGPVRSVSSQMGKVSNLEIDVEDTADMVMEHVSGIFSSLHLDYLQRLPVRRCKIVGTEGTMIWDYFSDSVDVYSIDRSEWVSHPYLGERNEMYIKELQHFVNCVENKKEPLITLENGVHVLQIALAAKKAAAQGRRQEINYVV